MQHEPPNHEPTIPDRVEVYHAYPVACQTLARGRTQFLEYNSSQVGGTVGRRPRRRTKGSRTATEWTTPNLLALRWLRRLWGGFDMALGGFARPFDVGSWMLDVGCWMFNVHHKHTEYNSPPTPPWGWSGGTLDIPWTHRTSQTPLFQSATLIQTTFARLFRPEAVFGFGCLALDVEYALSKTRKADLASRSQPG